MNFDTLLEDYLNFGILPILHFPNGMFSISYELDGEYTQNGEPTGITFYVGTNKGFHTSVSVAGTWNTSRYVYNSTNGWSIEVLH